jgi:hypothetical protein
MHRLSLTILLFTAMSPVAVAAPVGWPSGTAPCNTTLQACIDGVGSGITVEIRTSAPVNENLVINKNLDLVAARGVDANLATGRGITGTVSGAAAWNLTLRGLRLVNGRIDLNHSSSGAASLTFEDLRIESSAPGNVAGIRARLSNAAASTVRATGNRLRVSAPNLFDAGMEIEFSGGSGHLADIRWNSVESQGVSDGWGILGSAVNGTTAEFRMLGNEIRGEFRRDGIMVSEGLFSSTPSTVTARIVSNVVIGEGGGSGGIGSVVNQGNTSAQILNNTVVRADGISLSRWGGGGPPATGTTSGNIFNNIIAFNRWGLQNLPAAGGTATNNYNLLHRNTNPGAHTAGVDDVNADPLLRSLDAPRLGVGSPAIDAGNALALIGGGPLPLLDADGLRRLVNGDGAGPADADIGAYEYGHRMLLAGSGGAFSNYFPINDPLANVSNASRLFTTLNRFVNPTSINPRPVGVFLGGSGLGWSIFNQDISAMSPTLAYNVFHPLPSSTLQMVTVGATLPGSPNAIALPSPGSLDIVLAEQNWNGNGTTGIYNNNPIAVGFEAGSWFLHNANGVALPANAKFNVYWQPPSPNAFEILKTPDDPLTEFAVLIDHPLLNGTPCAQFVVTPTSDAPAAENGAIFDLTYSNVGGGFAGNKWVVFSHSGAIANKRYHVLVVPEQISDCTKGPLFRDQFEP